MKWFKFYHEFRSNPKLCLLTPHHQWAFVILLCLAAEGSTRGRIDGLTDEEIAMILRMPVEEWQILKDRFQSRGLIEFDESGAFIPNWTELEGLERYQDREYLQHQCSVFERDGYRCVYCGAGDRLTLDHIIPQSRGGSHEPENLATCCSSCNSSKGARTPDEWRRRL